MEYRLEIYPFSGDHAGDCVKVFTSTAPFPPLHAGDLLDASTWEHTGFNCLRVLSVEHAIMEKSPLGIDPSGRIINRTLIQAEGVLESARHEAPASLYLER